MGYNADTENTGLSSFV